MRRFPFCFAVVGGKVSPWGRKEPQGLKNLKNRGEGGSKFQTFFIPASYIITEAESDRDERKLSKDGECTMRDERKLIRNIKYGQDREAANELISHYYQEIFAYAFRQTGDQELAMDLAQEIFLSVLRGIGGFDERKAGFRTWLYRIASNRITDYYRSSLHRQRGREVPLHREGKQDDRYLEGEQGGGYSGRERAEDKLWENDVLSHLLRKEQICRVMELAAGYDRVWMLIFQRKIFLEHSFREIAEDLGIPESTVKTRYYQMIRGIREEMERDEKRTGK